MSHLPPKGKPDIPIPVVDEGETNEHMKAMWAGQSNVLVAVRVRPLMKHDIVKKSCVRVLDAKVVVILDPASGDKQDVLRANRNREKQYAFDYVFDPNSKQEMVYNNTTKFLIHGVLDGYNATVFAYGQTGSGKTHTMIGSQSDPGIMVRVMEDLFVHSQSQGKQQGVQYKVTVSFLEVYNENIRDLLSDVEEYLDLREDPIKGPVVASITEIEATSGSEVMQLLHQGNAKRSQAATAANEVSSRSHAVLQVVVECRDRAPGTVANIKVGKLSLVDLAGSERAANTKNVGARLVEGANINRSLLALGNCINALGEKGNKGNFVPYRDSKLTRLLKDSLGGNCRTVMIANISAAESSFEETLNTLKYANRAKNIKTNVQRNVLNVNYHISEYVELINNLRSEIQILKSQIGGSMGGGVGEAGRVPTRDGGIVGSASHVHLHHHDIPDLGAGGRDGALRILTPVSRIDPSMRSPALRGPSTPFQALRESLKTGGVAGMGALAGGIAGNATMGEGGRELVNAMRQKIVENFQERMQLRRSLIELEDQNVQNSIEVSKRQLLVIQWSEKHGQSLKKQDLESFTKADFAHYITEHGDGSTVEAWEECEQLRKAIIKNNAMKKNIAKRLRLNEKEAEKFREELGDKITGEDRRELMSLQYQVGRLELENMELEQHRIVHESILKGKDLSIQKLKLQLAVRDKVLSRQQQVLREHGLDDQVGYDQMGVWEESVLGGEAGDFSFGDAESGGVGASREGLGGGLVPPSPLKNVREMMLNITPIKKGGAGINHSTPNKPTPSPLTQSPSKKPPPPIPTLPIRKPALDDDDDEGADVEGDSDGDDLSIPPRAGAGRGAVHPLPLSQSLPQGTSSTIDTAGAGGGDTGELEGLGDGAVDFDPPLLSDREVALTSRDRDLIGEGDWAEIQSELSDNSSTFYDPPHRKGVPGAAGAGAAEGRSKVSKSKNKKGAASAQAQPQGNANAAAAAVGEKANVGVGYRKNAPSNVVPAAALIPPQNPLPANSNKASVHNPRGGRLYRSSVQKGEDPVPSDDDNPPYVAPAKSKFRHYPSPRKEDKGGAGGGVPPIGGDRGEEIGVLSGRKYSKNGGVGAGGDLGSLYDFSPRNDAAAANGNNANGYAPIFPLSNQSSSSNIGGGGAIRSTALSVINSHKGKAGAGGEEEVVDVLDTSGGGGGENPLVVRSKGLGGGNKVSHAQGGGQGGRAGAAGNAGAGAGVASNSNANNNKLVSPMSLMGGGGSEASLITIEGLTLGGGKPPQNRSKPNNRKSLLKSALSPGEEPSASHDNTPMPLPELGGEGLSIQGRMKSLPHLVSPRADSGHK